MEPLTREAVRIILVAAGTKPDIASLYANSFVEYQEAMLNITSNGAITANPRTGAPMENPFLKIRDRAEGRLITLRRLVTGYQELWGAGESQPSGR